MEGTSGDASGEAPDGFPTPPPELPSRPYRGLDQYGAADAPLFTGRAHEVEVCARLLARVNTRLLLLHGQTGCGKSSFLRAGLIPALERRGFGYLFLREYPDDDAPGGTPLFIRSGKDPLSRLGEEIYRWLQHPLELNTELGLQTVSLADLAEDAADAADFVRLRGDPHELALLLTEIRRRLPYTLVIVIDQVEEVLTLNAGDSDPPHRQAFFEFLRKLGTGGPTAKLVLSLRKDHSGEFIGLAQINGSLNADFRMFLLTDLGRDDVREAIERPTTKTPLPGFTVSPYSKYRFEYAAADPESGSPGLVDIIVDDLFTAFPKGANLPVMQIVCQDLYDRVQSTPEPWIVDEALYRRATLTQSVARHVNSSLTAAFKSGRVAGAGISAGTRWRRSATGVRPFLRRVVTFFWRAIGLQDDEASRWRSVLYKLVRHEGDGRVHTDVVRRSMLVDLANKLEVENRPEDILDYLALPEVLILRPVVAVGHALDEPMCSLGHDVIGLALAELQIADRERASERTRRTVVASAAIAAIVAVAGFAWWSIENRDRDTQDAVVASLLKQVATEHDEHPMRAMQAAASAVRATEEMTSGRFRSGQQARTVLAGYLDALPDFSAALPSEDGHAPLVGLLSHPPGYVVASAEAGVHVHRLAGDGVIREEQMEPLKSVVSPSGQMYMNSSEPKEGTVVLMLNTPLEPEASNRSAMYLIQNGHWQGPFTAGLLLDNYLVQRYGQAASPEETQQITAALSDDVVVLIDEVGRVRHVRTLAMNPRDGGDPFVPGTEFTEDLTPEPAPAAAAAPAPVPASATLSGAASAPALAANAPHETRTQFSLGHHWLMADISQRNVEAHVNWDLIAGRSLHRNNDESAAQAGLAWRQSISTLQKLPGCTPAQPCHAEAAGVPTHDSLMLLTASIETSQSAYGRRTNEDVGLLVLDADTGKSVPIPRGEIESALKTCSSPVPRDTHDALAASSLSSSEFDRPQDNHLEFISGQLDDFVIGFTGQSSVRLVRVRTVGTKRSAVCTERLHAAGQILAWQFVPKRNLLLATSRDRFVAWNLAKPASNPAQTRLQFQRLDEQLGRAVPDRASSPPQVSAAAAADEHDHQGVSP